MLLSKGIIPDTITFWPSEFQSLFFWMLLSKCCAGDILPGGSGGFNPYFSGCFSLSSCSVSSQYHVFGFNPYFSGCFSLRRDAPSSRMRRRESFNPYFSGCFSLRFDIVYPFPLSVPGFNPYFSGCFSLSKCCSVYLIWIQSFNPYFSGCFSLRRYQLHLYGQIGIRVSILIFLDASL